MNLWGDGGGITNLWGVTVVSLKLNRWQIVVLSDFEWLKT